MTKHIKLTQGQLMTVQTETEPSVPVDFITGRLIGIIDGENDKTCFVFQSPSSSEDFFRLYLRNHQRPCTRLLMLLCSKIAEVATSDFTIKSNNTYGSGQSRLTLSCISNNEEGFAPFVLPESSSRLNENRIAWLKAALCLTELRPLENNPVNIEMTTGELSSHAPLVVGGLNGSDVNVTRVDSREVTLVHGHPLFAIVYESENEKNGGSAEDTLREIIQNTSVINHVSKNFVTAEERESYLNGVKFALEGNGTRRLFSVTDKENVNACLQIIANYETR